jgi:probable F420-dependent oxidoreductase
MKIGAVFSQSDSGTDPDAIRDWARTAEAEGFEHLLAYDHVLGASLERLRTGGLGGFSAPAYTIDDLFHEILMLFGHLSAVTDRLEFVTSVLVLPQRQAPLVAKQIATLDLLSGGRISPAVGVGWNFAEYEALGVDFSEAARRFEEQMDVIRALWADPLVSFEGEFHRLEGVGINPRPTRQIPLFVGSRTSDAAIRRVARKADGWLPLYMSEVDPFPIRRGVVRLREICEEIGRDPATLPIHGRAHLGENWRFEVEEALDLGFSRFSIAFDRRGNPGRSHKEHLEALIAAKDEIDSIVY